MSASSPTRDYVMAIDQGTTSSRAILFDHAGSIVSIGQLEHEQIFPRAGWVEHDPLEIWRNVRRAVADCLSKAELDASRIAAVGITNQRETTVVWNRHTGEPVYNAIVWQDIRTREICERLAAGAPEGGPAGDDRYRERVGLSLATYFAGPKIAWILENVPGARAAAEAGDLLFGTTDTWLLWNLTGGPQGPGPKGGVHLTDVTNASRTMLMDIRSLSWEADIAADFGIPMSMLPEIRTSSEVYGHGRPHGFLAGVPIAGILGDQQAATFGHACFTPGQSKNTYGTGNFMLMNTGGEPVISDNGLLTTVAYQLGGRAPVYALEGSIAVSGSLIQWLRDNLGMLTDAAQSEALAKSVPDSGDTYIVPAFSGLFAPYWRPDARGVIVGLTRFVNRAHIVRAALESTAYQSREVIEAMNADSGVALSELRVDGGMTDNDFLMQFQADLLQVPVVRPQITEVTALGAAFAAGIAVGFWRDEDDVTGRWQPGRRWTPQMPRERVEELFSRWKQAVTRTFDWVE
ncbi:glycerol kinase GlpK [Brevibacterium sp. 50QC2O2]|uniref:glycerol kinase GlpK n=1 Tax=Brevibacterium TaxID=1696 RepID=UPI00211C8E78|nr:MULTISPECIES: glycerol kinase GlpK [unclassified Brevibacterium]MCQ9385304.1 glycerol kinase GlpK [Brevibacterium sp. 68QC2CO]MCQ9388810.1 glycerol kinase GlpK [Brevibacterium sp. 50QC2O2]